MKVSNWRNMFLYGLGVLSALAILLSLQISPQEKTNLRSYSMVTPVNETYFDSESSKIYISGNTSLPNPASMLTIESANYSREKRLLEIQLGSKDTSGAGTAVPTVIQEPVPYTLKTNFSGPLPDSVIVYGVFQEVETFSPETAR